MLVVKDIRDLFFCSLILLGVGLLAPHAWSQASEGSVGILIDYDPPGSGSIVVYAVTYKSPADKARVKRGDRLLRVNDHEVTGMPLEGVAKLIRGPVGTSVNLSISTSSGAVREVPLTRTTLREGPQIAVPPPSQVGGGLYLSEKEKALVKQKIIGLKTDAQRQRMWQLLRALKDKKLSKPKFMQAIKTEFP